MMEKKYKVALIHTSPGLLNDLKALFEEMLPDVEMINIIDDSLLEEVKKNGSVTPAVTKRICTYALTAQEMGAQLIMCQCSSVGKAGTVARNLLDVPYLKIDEPMAQEAVRLGEKIAVIGTVACTMEPSSSLVEEMAAKAGKQVKVTPYLADGGREHVLQTVRLAAQLNDVIVLAQGSMAALVPLLSDIGKPVLSSPRLALERICEMLDQQ